MYIQNSYRYGVSGTDFTGADAIYSLRKFFGWGKAILKIRRSSDNATAFLFFNGSSSSDLITTSGFISLSSNTTPDTGPNVTLATWIGSDDGFVDQWIPQIPDGNIDSDLVMFAGVNQQPQIVDAGVIITENSLPAIKGDGNRNLFLTGTHIPSLGTLGGDSANTVLTVAANDNNNGVGAIFSATNSSSRKYTHFNERSSIQRLGWISTSSGDYRADLISQVNSASVRLITTTIDGSKKMTSYYNATFQNDVTFLNSYENGAATLMSQQGSSTRLNGRIQEIIIFPTDKTSDLTALHSDINAYYSIY